jgi:hypothetical protein
MPGLAFCTLLAFYDFLCWAKLYERRLAAAPPAPVERQDDDAGREAMPLAISATNHEPG